MFGWLRAGAKRVENSVAEAPPSSEPWWTQAALYDTGTTTPAPADRGGSSGVPSSEPWWAQSVVYDNGTATRASSDNGGNSVIASADPPWYVVESQSQLADGAARRSSAERSVVAAIQLREGADADLAMREFRHADGSLTVYSSGGLTHFRNNAASYRQILNVRQEEATALGQHYAYGDGFGWKIHVNVATDATDPLTSDVARFLGARSDYRAYKIGVRGEQVDGSGMTIYVGDRDTAERLSADLHRTFGARLTAPEELRGTDMELYTGIGMRFDPQGNPRYAQYGVKGFAALDSTHRDVFWMADKAAARDILTVHSFNGLTNDYGAFFTGTRDYDRLMGLARSSTPGNVGVVAQGIREAMMIE